MARTQLNFRVGQDVRDRWESHVDGSPHYDKVSDLIKTAVREQIQRDSGSHDVDEQQRFGIVESEMLEEVRALRTTVDDLADEVQTATDALAASMGIDPELGPTILSVLRPSKENAMTEGEVVDKVAEEGHDWDMGAVRFALELIEANTNAVEKIPEGSEPWVDQTRWYLGGSR